MSLGGRKLIALILNFRKGRVADDQHNIFDLRLSLGSATWRSAGFRHPNTHRFGKPVLVEQSEDSYGQTRRAGKIPTL